MPAPRRADERRIRAARIRLRETGARAVLTSTCRARTSRAPYRCCAALPIEVSEPRNADTTSRSSAELGSTHRTCAQRGLRGSTPPPTDRIAQRGPARDPRSADERVTRPEPMAPLERCNTSTARIPAPGEEPLPIPEDGSHTN